LTRNDNGAGTFFELAKTGDIGRMTDFLRSTPMKLQEVLDSVDRTSYKTGLHFATEEG